MSSMALEKTLSGIPYGSFGLHSSIGPEGRSRQDIGVLFRDLKTIHKGFFPVESKEYPIVMAQSQSYNEEDPIVTRLTQVTTERFSVKLCEQSNGAHRSEDVGYIAMEPGAGVMSGSNFVAKHLDEYVKDVSNEDKTTIDIKEHVSGAVRFIADMQTYRDPTTANLRCRNPGETIRVAIENHGHTQVPHSNEKIGFFAIEDSCAIFAERVVTDPDNNDTDGDGIFDNEEKDGAINAIYSDSDGDGISDLDEANMEFSYYDEDKGCVVVGKLDPKSGDTDDDGVSDYDEINGQNIRYVTDYGDKGYYFSIESGGELFQIEYHTNPLIKDTDGVGAMISTMLYLRTMIWTEVMK